VSRPTRQTVALIAALVTSAAVASMPAAASARHQVEVLEGTPSGESSTGLGESPTPGSEPHSRRGRERCTLTLEGGSGAPSQSGEAVALTGALSCPDATAAEGQTVTIFAREAGSALHELSTVTTGPGGSFALHPVLTADTLLLARAPGARQARLALKVTAAVTLAGPASAALLTRSATRRAGQVSRFTFTGTVAPAVAGARVALQGRYSPAEPWRTVKFTRTDEEGRFSFTRAFRRAGELSLRAALRLHGHVHAYSPVLTYLLGQAQDAGLTIAAASNPLPAGSSTTISGVLDAGAGKPVALLARTPGGGFAQVATALSGEGGAYSFDVSPSVDTSYRVRSGRRSSSVLFLGVVPLLSLGALPSSAEAGKPVRIEGQLTGAPAGTRVRLEREEAPERSVTLATTTTGAGGSFSFSLSFLQAGDDTLRVATPASASILGALSESFTLSVSAAEGEG